MGAGRDNAVVHSVAAAAPDETLFTQTVERCRRALTVSALVEHLLYVSALAGLVLLAVIIGDHSWGGGLPRAALAALMVVWSTGLLGGLVGSVAVARLRRLNAVYVARRLEQAGGIRHNSVINALLLQEGGHATHAHEAVLRQATRDMAQHPPVESLGVRSGRRAAAALLAVLIAWGLYVLAAPRPVGPSLARFFGARVAVAPATWLELVRPAPGDVVHAGEALPIEIAVHGRSVAEVHFDVLDERDETGVSARLTALADPATTKDQRRRLMLPPFAVRGDIRYRCRAGDATLEGVIRVQPQPELEGMEVILEPPAYTRWGRTVAPGADLDVLAGTQATFRMRANVAVTDPVFVLQGVSESRTRMSVAAETPQSASVTLTLTQSGTYRVEFGDQWGFPYRNSAARRIEVRPDRPPTVRIAVPAEGQVADDLVDVRQFPELVVIAGDDVAVEALGFVVQTGDLVSRPDVSVAGAKTGPEVVGRVRADELVSRPGQTAEVWFEATDGRALPDGRGGPQTTKSRALTLIRSMEPSVDKPTEPEAGTSQEPNGSERSAGGKERSSSRGSEEADPNSPGTGEGNGEGEPMDGTGGWGAADSQPAGGGSSQGSESQPAGGGAADGTDEGQPKAADGGAPTDGNGTKGGLEGELKRFVEEHGKEAGAAGRAARQSGGAASKPAQEPNAPTATPPAERDGENGPQPNGTSEAPQAGEDQGGQVNGRGSAGERGQVEGEQPAGAGSIPGRGGGELGGTEPEPGMPAESQPAAVPPPPPPAGDLGPQEASGVVETLKLLEMMERGQVVTEDMLVDAGWPRAQAAEFVRALERLHAAARPAGGAGAVRRMLFDTRVGNAERPPGRALSSDVGRELSPADAQQDGLGRIAPAPDQRVSGDLEALLEAYYRALAAQRAREQ